MRPSVRVLGSFMLSLARPSNAMHGDPNMTFTVFVCPFYPRQLVFGVSGSLRNNSGAALVYAI